MPAAQTNLENCVAHNGSLIPIPGRDVMVQAWYQGGISVFDWTDAAHPKEIAYFDRGPMDSTRLVSGGYWSSYWYNGYIVGSEISRGKELGLDPSRRYKLLRCPDELAKGAATFNNKPLLFDHNPVTADAHDHDRTVGSVSNPEFVSPFLYADLSCWSGPAPLRVRTALPYSRRLRSSRLMPVR